MGRFSFFHSANPAAPPAPFLAAAAALLLFLAVSESLPPTWDEGDTAARADSALGWSHRALSPCRAERSDWSDRALR
ncbi:MAG: hypothetical protein IKT12_04950, partial [Thermoguttaceae bacterium]|nr:hypothetical protein [Thermoguttaceae bacterium]